jgi:hypothetical protein
MFATPAELATHLQTATQDEHDAGNPDVLDTGVATQALESATAEIRSVCGWSITQETVTDEPYEVERWISLPTLYLTAVAISYDGSVLPAGDAFTWRRSGTIDMSPWRMLVINRSTARWVDLLITYTHGHAVVPPVVKAICLERAAAKYTNPAANLSETRSTVVTVYGRGTEGSTSQSALANDSRLVDFKLPGL